MSDIPRSSCPSEWDRVAAGLTAADKLRAWFKGVEHFAGGPLPPLPVEFPYLAEGVPSWDPSLSEPRERGDFLVEGLRIRSKDGDTFMGGGLTWQVETHARRPHQAEGEELQLLTLRRHIGEEMLREAPADFLKEDVRRRIHGLLADLVDEWLAVLWDMPELEPQYVKAEREAIRHADDVEWEDD